jgi:hypothetical protein
VSEAETVSKATVLKVDEGLGLVFGWAIVCTENGEPYFDLNVDREGTFKGEKIPENIPEDEMLKSALQFAEETECPANEMHVGADKGSHVFLFPLTSDIAKALDIETKKTGLLIAYKPPADVLAKFKDGTYTGFSIQGHHVNSELIDA